ncbi:MAG TPA: hypothetical protein VKV06_12600, partial [Acidimicrobiales bacterium]|nr:hypothetical protein [Acidimicrobiales bacterium]
MTDDAPSRAGVRSPVPAGQHGVMSRLDSIWQSMRRWVVDRPSTETAISEVGTVRRGLLSHPISATATATPSGGGRWSGRGELIGRASSLVWLVFVAFPLTQLYADRSAGLVHTIVVTVVATMFVGLVAVLMLLPQSGSEALSPPTATALIGALWVLTAFLAYFDRPSWVYEFIFSVFPAVHLLGRRARTVLVVDGVA